MAIKVPSIPALSAKLQNLVAQLAERNGQYQSTTWASIQVGLWCDAGRYIIKDWWLSAPPPGLAGTGGFAEMMPWNGVKTSATITPTTTASQCTTIATTMVNAILAQTGPTFVTE